jgi:hypothetical protein
MGPAALYAAETRVLIQAVKRNKTRFPEDFMLRLAAAEWDSLRSQIDLRSATWRTTICPLRFY